MEQDDHCPLGTVQEPTVPSCCCSHLSRLTLTLPAAAHTPGAPALTFSLSNHEDDSAEENRPASDQDLTDADALDVIGVGKCGRCGARLPLDMESIEAHTVECEREFKLKKSRFMTAVRASMAGYMSQLLGLATPGATPLGGASSTSERFGSKESEIPGGVVLRGDQGGLLLRSEDLNRNDEQGAVVLPKSPSSASAKSVEEVFGGTRAEEHFLVWLELFRETGEEQSFSQREAMEETLRPLWLEVVANTRKTGRMVVSVVKEQQSTGAV